MTTIACTVTVSAGAECGAVAVRTWEGRLTERTFGECAEHVSGPITPTAPISEVGRRVAVQHCGVRKVGVVTRSNAATVAVSVPVKPHGKAATTREVRFAREAVRFV